MTIKKDSEAVTYGKSNRLKQLNKDRVELSTKDKVGKADPLQKDFKFIQLCSMYILNIKTI